MWVRSLGREDPLEECIATHSSILAWRTPWTEEPGGAMVHGVAQSRTQLKQLSIHTHNPCLYHYLEHSGDILLCIHVLSKIGKKQIKGALLKKQLEEHLHKKECSRVFNI